MIISSSTV